MARIAARQVVNTTAATISLFGMSAAIGHAKCSRRPLMTPRDGRNFKLNTTEHAVVSESLKSEMLRPR